MTAKKSQALPIGILLLALAASVALLVYLLLAPTDSGDTAEAPGGAGDAGGAVEFEFYERLRQNEVRVNDPVAEQSAPSEPAPIDIEQLAEQLTQDAPASLETASRALEQLAEAIVGGLDTPVPDPVAAPEPLPPVPEPPRLDTEIVLAAPAPAETGDPAEPTREERADAPGTVLQSGAFRRRELALSELERQRDLGFDVEILQRPGQDGPLFLLQSGPYPSLEKLEEAEMVFRLHNVATARLR